MVFFFFTFKCFMLFVQKYSFCLFMFLTSLLKEKRHGLLIFIFSYIIIIMCNLFIIKAHQI